MTTFCLACSITSDKLSEDSPEYATWQKRHADFCQINHSQCERR